MCAARWLPLLLRQRHCQRPRSKLTYTAMAVKQLLLAGDTALNVCYTYVVIMFTSKVWLLT